MRQDYCPIGGAPCQSMCDEPCLSTAKKRIAELELALQKQAKAALQGMDSAKSNAAEMLKSANEIQSRLNPELIESERQANAVLTEENEKLIEVVRQRSHKIAELEKDCDILATNYDAARRASRFTADVADQALADLKAAEKQIEQLREALSLLLDCAIHGYDMPEDHSYAIISRNALEQTE